MKIKVDHYIAKKLAEVIEETVVGCIAENKMFKEFSLSDIKGKVSVGSATHLGFGTTLPYQYSVSLFDRIQLVTNAIFVPMGTITTDIKRTVMTAIGAMMMAEHNPTFIMQSVSNAIAQAIKTPNTEVTFTLYEELEFKFQYYVNEDIHGFFVDIATDERTLGKHYSYGSDKSAVMPTFTGVHSILMNTIINFKPKKERKFYITEHTFFQNPTLMGGIPTMAMTNQNPIMPGYAYAGNPPNFNMFNGNMNSNEPFSQF